MAIVHYDPSIDFFSNKLGTFVYYRNRSTPCVRRWVMPRNPRTELQQHGRRCFADAVRLWQGLEPYKKSQWNRRALARHISGYNLFISEHLKATWADGSAVIPGSSFFVHDEPLRSRSVSRRSVDRSEYIRSSPRKNGGNT